MEDALEAGAADFEESDEAYEITTEPDDLSAVRDALEQAGYTFVSAETEKVPSLYVDLDDEDSIKKMRLLLEHLDENEDVVEVWHNWNNDDE